MNQSDDKVKILAPPEAVSRVSRRMFLGGAMGAAIGGSVLLTACGEEESPSADSAPAGEVEDALNMFTWGEYNAPKVIKEFETENGLKFTLDSYNSNEALIAKLTAAQGTGGYDLVVPTGPFIPALVANELIQELDLSRLKNFGNLEEQYKDQEWDPGNQYSICKDWGTTGYAVDRSKYDVDMATWQDFLDLATGDASGDVSILDSPDNVVGLWLWANNYSWMTTDTAQLDECEDYLLNQLAPHIKAFQSYPGGGDMQNGNFGLVHAWNGDARLGILQSEPDAWEWVFPGPKTEIWMDTYAIPVGAPHPNAAYAWMDYLLQPEVSLEELEYIGYHTGVADIEPMAEEAGLERLDMVFFDEEQVATMEPGILNEAQDRRVEIYDKVKASAGG